MLLDQATAMLACLDADGLETLRVRALAMQADLQVNLEGVSLPELTARLRVFANVVVATGRNLQALRVGNGPVPEAQAGVNVWAR